MENCRFEGLTRQIGAARGRRDALKILLGTAAASVPVLGLMIEDSLASKLAQGCRIAGQRCNDDKDCCGKTKCARKRCRCLRSGKSCLIVLDEELGLAIPNKSLCCSGDCRRVSKECK